MISPGRGAWQLLSTADASPLALVGAPALLGVQAPLPRSRRRLGGATVVGCRKSLRDPSHQSVYGVLPISLLRTETPRLDYQDAIVGEPVGRQAEQPLLDVAGKRGGTPDIKAEAHGRLDFVDVLPARPGRPEELEAELVGEEMNE